MMFGRKHGRSRREKNRNTSPSPEPPALSMEEAQERLRELRASSPVVWTVSDPDELDRFSRGLAEVAIVLAPQSSLGPLLVRAADRVNDAGAWLEATEAMFDIHLHALGVAPMTHAVALAPSADSLIYLGIALERAGSPQEAARMYQAHPEILAANPVARLLAADCISLSGDLGTTRSLLRGLEVSGEMNTFAERVGKRCLRGDALVGSAVDALRCWEAVLHGTVVLHCSEVGEDSMHGRYAALWDDGERLVTIVDSLASVLGWLGRPPMRVVTGADRHSVVLGEVIARRLGLGPPQDWWTEAPPGVVTLVVQFAWTDTDVSLVKRYRSDHDAVLFAYWMDWGESVAYVPDVVGLEAQYLWAPWDAAMRFDGSAVVTVPADDRPAQIVGAELAAIESSLSADEAQVLFALTDAIGRARDHFGITGGRRWGYTAGGPVPSNRFR